MIDRSEWRWFGHVAHFICGRWCRFHMATLVGDYLVSTVGEYLHPSKAPSERAEAEYLRANGFDEIGYDRKYETMVFAAGTPCEDAKCGCGLPEISGSELEFDGYNDAGSATRGHYAMCEKVARGDVGKED